MARSKRPTLAEDAATRRDGAIYGFDRGHLLVIFKQLFADLHRDGSTMSFEEETQAREAVSQRMFEWLQMPIISPLFPGIPPRPDWTGELICICIPNHLNSGDIIDNMDGEEPTISPASTTRKRKVPDESVEEREAKRRETCVLYMAYKVISHRAMVGGLLIGELGGTVITDAEAKTESKLQNKRYFIFLAAHFPTDVLRQIRVPAHAIFVDIDQQNQLFGGKISLDDVVCVRKATKSKVTAPSKAAKSRAGADEKIVKVHYAQTAGDSLEVQETPATGGTPTQVEKGGDRIKAAAIVKTELVPRDQWLAGRVRWTTEK